MTISSATEDLVDETVARFFDFLQKLRLRLGRLAEAVFSIVVTSFLRWDSRNFSPDAHREQDDGEEDDERDDDGGGYSIYRLTSTTCWKISGDKVIPQASNRS